MDPMFADALNFDSLFSNIYFYLQTLDFDSSSVSNVVFICSQTKVVTIILVRRSVFNAIFRLTNFLSDSFNF